MKQSFRAMLALSLGCALCFPILASGALYSDVGEESWYAPIVSELSQAGIISGYPDGTFQPEQDATVGECLSLILLTSGHGDQTPPEGAHWARGLADYALEQGFLSPEILADLDAPISRLQAGLLASRALGLSPAEEPVFADTQDPEINALYEAGAMVGSIFQDQRVFLPEKTITRAEISAVVWNLRNALREGRITPVSEDAPKVQPDPEEPPLTEEPVESQTDPLPPEGQEDGDRPEEETPPAPEPEPGPEDTALPLEGDEESFTHGDWIFYRDRYITILPDLDVNAYDPEAFVRDEKGRIQYTGAGVETRQGIDVSNHQGDIDWEQAAGDGVDFVFIRVGYRGYGGDGRLCNDIRFEQNIQGALEAGLEVGVYYFSQATNEAEAVEEAEYVIDKLKPYQDRVTYPVVFDWEDSTSSSLTYRVHGMSTQELCQCAQAFCERVAREGYQPMIYFNQHDGYLRYDLSLLDQYPFWYAQYPVQTNAPGFYYDFDYWQYDSHGHVAGIETRVDLNLQLIKTEDFPTSETP